MNGHGLGRRERRAKTILTLPVGAADPLSGFAELGRDVGLTLARPTYRSLKILERFMDDLDGRYPHRR
ncbi:MAG: hypothetical protein ABSD80_13875 [Caulobacteraceae bacterium]